MEERSMSDAFNDREKSYEAKYKLDEEQAFKVQARRNKLLGLMLAEKFGMTGDAAQAYAKEVVIADLDEPGDEDVIRKVMADIAEKGIDMSEDEVRNQLKTLESVAVEQIKGDYPEALDKDHKGTRG
jgi:hypothetical protein